MNKTKNLSEEKQDENLDKGFTVREIASFIDETPNVIRNWFKELREYIPHEKNSNGYNLYKRDGIDRFKEIQTLHREQNWSIKQIEHYFATGGESFKPEPKKTAGEMLAEEIRGLREDISALREENKEIKEHLVNQENFNIALLERLEQTERGTLERDQLLIQSLNENLETKKSAAAAIREIQETKLFTAATQENEKKKSWYEFWK